MAHLSLQAEHRVADALRPDFARAAIAALRSYRQELSLKDLAAHYDSQPLQLIQALPWQEAGHRFRQRSKKLYQTILLQAARAARRGHPVLQRIEVQKQEDDLSGLFDLEHPRAARWADAQAAELVTGITEDTRQAIRQQIARMWREGITVDQAARELRRTIGLTPQQANAVANFLRARQEEDDPNADTKADDYSDRLLRFRAQTIARTETIRAAAQGSQELWHQAAEQGIIERDRAMQEWLITPDEALCPICASIADSDPVPLDTPFRAADGELYDAPPAHPNCRCAVRLVFPEAIPA